MRDPPEGLAVLAELALDLRRTWSHAADALWQRIDWAAWDRTGVNEPARQAWTAVELDQSGAKCEPLNGDGAQPGIPPHTVERG
jgi:hypothetical protein